MSSGSSLPYQLRPNKAVDRELFLSFLSRFAATLKLEKYGYIGLGGPFLEDFRLIHARLAIKEMVCVEAEENVHRRQLFNCPVDCIDCVHSTLEDYLDSNEIENPSIIWFDYTEPGGITDQIERFSRTVGEVPIGSILRITLNANPTSLGNPDSDEITTEDGPIEERQGGKKNLQEWRLERFRERMGATMPSGLAPEDMTFKRYGQSILRALSLAVDRHVIGLPDRKVTWVLATHYADGQPMVTATLVVLGGGEDKELSNELIEEWEFYSTANVPLRLDMPALSALERLQMESSSDAKTALGFELPKSDMGQDPFESFKKFYRVFPHFSRVEVGP
ncbi:O-methyltransferase [Thiolapillus sp.]|uniref:O-methyltransferase n=1 Tax=Thiolapillus sp. TaxID=2017437 RepID=UPI0025D3243F|nr:O-methyltransferase [Thiolapillus sp.]